MKQNEKYSSMCYSGTVLDVCAGNFAETVDLQLIAMLLPSNNHPNSLPPKFIMCKR